MPLGSEGSVRFVVRIKRQDDWGFWWEIQRKGDIVEIIERSTRLLSTRTEAIIESARAAAMLYSEPSIEGEDAAACIWIAKPLAA